MNFDIGPTGIWHCATKEPHSFDLPLASAISEFLRKEKCSSVIDFGCGAGDYTNHLRICGFDTVAVDGNPKTPEFCKNAIVLDVSLPIDREGNWAIPIPKPADWVMCLEVGEHIPSEHSKAFLDNLNKLCSFGIILSWFPEDGHGIGHVNPRPNGWVKGEMIRRGFTPDEDAQKQLREASTLWWFFCSLMIFRRV